MNRDRSFRVTRTLLLFLALALCTSSCAGEPASPNTPVPSHAGGRLPDGLPEGINNSFLSEDLDVEKFIERFEGESREVFAGRHAIVAALDVAKGDQIADIGAGTGFFSLLFADRVGQQGDVYAVEISPKFLDHLRKLAPGEDRAPVHVVEGTMTSVELATASVDLAFLCDVYHHFESPSATLASLLEAVRPGGSLVVIDFERIPGESPKWMLDHVRAGKEVFRSEIERAGFVFDEEIQLSELSDNYILRFVRP